MLGHMPLHRVSASALETLYVDLVKSGLSAGAVRKVAAVLHAGLKAAVKTNLIMRTPAENVMLPPASKRTATIWMPAQICAYLEDARKTATPAVYALYCVLFGAGTPIGEVTGGSDDAFHAEQGVLRIERTLKRGGKTPAFAPPKTEAGTRAVLLPDEVTAAVRAAVTWKKMRRLKLGAKLRHAGTPLCGTRGRPLDRHALRTRDHLPRIERLKLPYAHLHAIRHMHGPT